MRGNNYLLTYQNRMPTIIIYFARSKTYILFKCQFIDMGFDFINNYEFYILGYRVTYFIHQIGIRWCSGINVYKLTWLLLYCSICGGRRLQRY